MEVTKRVDVIFVDRNADVSEADIKRMEENGLVVVKLVGNPNQTTRRETFDK